MNRYIAGLAASVIGATTIPLGTAVASASPTTSAATATVSARDVTWMRNNDQTDLAEITISRIALKRAEHADTRATARVTLRNHETVLARLEALARSLDVALPATPNAKEQAQAAKLEVIARGNFDRRWDTDQIAGHELSIAQTRDEIAHGSARVVAFARYYLPIARRHLQMAKADLRELNIEHWAR